MPGACMSTRNVVRPRCLGTSGSVRHTASVTSATCALEVHTFWPVITHSSPSRTARRRRRREVGSRVGFAEQLTHHEVAAVQPGQVRAPDLRRRVREERRPDEADRDGEHREVRDRVPALELVEGRRVLAAQRPPAVLDRSVDPPEPGVEPLRGVARGVGELRRLLGRCDLLQDRDPIGALAPYELLVCVRAPRTGRVEERRRLGDELVDRDHVPVNSGARFSAKAVAPSRASSLANTGAARSCRGADVDVEQATGVVHDLLRQRDRQRCVRRDLLGECDRGREDLLARDHAVHEAVVQRAGRVHRGAGQRQLQHDGRWEPERRPAGRADADQSALHLGQAEQRMVGCDHDVAAQHDAEPTGDRGAVHRRHDRLRVDALHEHLGARTHGGRRLLVTRWRRTPSGPCRNRRRAHPRR